MHFLFNFAIKLFNRIMYFIINFSDFTLHFINSNLIIRRYRDLETHIHYNRLYYYIIIYLFTFFSRISYSLFF